jgi:AcrR family transcriptional regulator
MTGSPPQPPAGVRARRIPQQELRTRMLDAAEGLLGDRGLGVNAYPLNMEDLIRQVGVPRSSAFQAFGTKENLVFQLALRMLQPESPLAAFFAGTMYRVADEVVEERPALAADAAGRRALLNEVVRRAVRRNHDVLVGSARWRTFRALSMSLDSFPDDERAELERRLHSIQDQFLEVMAECYLALFERFGVRLRPGLGMPHFVRASSSVLEGIATTGAFGPPTGAETLILPGVDGDPVEWHLVSVAVVGLIDGMTEPAR